MDFLNINGTVQHVIRIAKGVAREYSNANYAPAHLLYALMHRETALDPFIEALGIDPGYIREWAEVRIGECPKQVLSGDIVASPEANRLFEQADNIRLKWGLLEIDPLCLLAAIATPGAGFSADELRSFPIREKEIYDHLFLGKTATNPEHEFEEPVWSAKQGNLAKYCIDKTASVAAGEAHPAVCREREMRMMMEILGRMGKPNVLIVGDAGVGKTAMVEGLAHCIVQGTVPQYLQGITVYELDTGTLIAGATYKGEIEERLKGVLKELEVHGEAVLFIDEIHTLLDAKAGKSGAAGILKPALAKGKITVIGATTIDEYRKLIEPDHAFRRRFEVLQVEEPDVQATVEMIESVLPRYETYHGVSVDRAALPECVSLAKRYIRERRLPDSAIDLIDRTLSAVKMINQSGADEIREFMQRLAEINENGESPEKQLAKVGHLDAEMRCRLSPILLGRLPDRGKVANSETPGTLSDRLLKDLEHLSDLIEKKISVITIHEVAAMVSASTGIPIGKIESAEKEKLIGMEELLRRRVVGQDNALKALADAIVESRSGMNRAGQPIGSFFLLGPTGTGKTELAKALAETLFDDEKAMIRFDMSEFKEEHSVALLLGAPPGYVGYEEGGILVNRIRRQPYSVVLFDEIEKAHQSVYDIFLQIMDEGRLHDRLGKEGDFSNAIVLFTSNVGSDWLAEQFGKGAVPATTDMMEIMGHYFRPEFLARLSEIVPFRPIDEEMLMRIFDIQLHGVEELLEKHHIKLEMTETAKKALAGRNFTPKYGARQIAGTIRQYVRRPLSRMIVSGSLNAGDTVLIDDNGTGEITWNTKQS